MLTLQETKVFLRVDGDEDDTLISSLIITAQVLTEDILRRPLSDKASNADYYRHALRRTTGIKGQGGCGYQGNTRPCSTNAVWL